MASCITPHWGNNYSPQVKLTVTSGSTTDTTVTLNYSLDYVTYGYTVSNNGVARNYTIKIGSSTITGSWNINGKTSQNIRTGTVTVNKGTAASSVAFSITFDFSVKWHGTESTTKSASGSISIPAKTSYTISYNANNGSGAPASQTKWYGTTLTLSSTKPTRTGYTFNKWNTAANGSGTNYNSEASYTANASATLYAQWTADTYTVSYNANGGSGAPGNQTKTYGTNLTLSSTIPTRTNYTFKGWGTSASATTVAYAPGASYTANAAIALYAIWELAYSKPTVTNLSVTRCNASSVADEYGEYALVKFSWSCDQTSGTNNVKTIVINNGSSNINVSASGTSGSVNQRIGTLSVETTFKITVTVTDNKNGATAVSKNLPAAKFPIDFLAGGTGVSIGKPAQTANLFDVNLPTKFNNNAQILNNYSYSGTDTGGNIIPMIGVSNTNNLWLGASDASMAVNGDTNIYAAKGNINLNPSNAVKVSAADLVEFTHKTTGKKVGFGVDSSGTNRGIYDGTNSKWMIYVNDANEIYLGPPKYSEYKPYYSKGETISIVAQTAGYITNSGKDLCFTVPLSKPIIGSPTVSVSSISTFVIRQGNKYLYGSSSSANATPSSYSIAIRAGGLRILATFGNTTNVMNNDTAGIVWEGIVTLS